MEDGTNRYTHPQTLTHTRAKISDVVSSSEGDARRLEPESLSSRPPESSLHIWSCSWVLRLGPFQGWELAEVRGGRAAAEGACEWPLCWALQWEGSAGRGCLGPARGEMGCKGD